jgi:hypothetical protein
MTTAEILAASRQELRLYRELWAVYDRLAESLAGERVDPATVADDGSTAAAVTAALHDLAATLAPLRLSAESVHHDVTAVWRESATLAAASADANRRLQAAARAQQLRVGRALGQMTNGVHAARRYQAAAN